MSVWLLYVCTPMRLSDMRLTGRTRQQLPAARDAQQSGADGVRGSPHRRTRLDRGVLDAVDRQAGVREFLVVLCVCVCRCHVCQCRTSASFILHALCVCFCLCVCGLGS